MSENENVEIPTWLVMLVGRLVIEAEAARIVAAQPLPTNGTAPAETLAEGLS